MRPVLRAARCGHCRRWFRRGGQGGEKWPGDFGQDDFFREIASLADEDSRGLRHSLDYQAVGHDGESRVDIVKVLFGEGYVLDRRRGNPRREFGDLSIQIQRIFKC